MAQSNYAYNRETYKTYTLRVNREKDAAVIEHLDRQKSMNAYVLDLIRADMKEVPQADAISYEVIEQRGNEHEILATHESMADAVKFLLLYVGGFAPCGRVYIVKKFTGSIKQSDITAGMVSSFENDSNLIVEEEEKKNAE